MGFEKEFMPREISTPLLEDRLTGPVEGNPLILAAKRLLRAALSSFLHFSGLLSVCMQWGKSRTLERRPGRVLPMVHRTTHSKLGILCYHRIGTEGVPLHSQLKSTVFEKQMRYLRKHYRIVSFDQLYRELRTAREVPPTIAITFDDGYRDLYRYAFPVLRKHGIPAMIYLIGESVESGSAPWYDRIFAAVQAFPSPVLEISLERVTQFTLASHADRIEAAWRVVCFLRTIDDSRRRVWCQNFEKRLSVAENELKDRMLNWQQVREMQAQGISFGGHTMTHPVVGRLAKGELEMEILHSKLLLEAGLGARVDHFAFPFGKPSDCSRASEEYLRQSGFLSAATTTEGFNTCQTNVFRLHRLQIGGDESLSVFAFEVARMFCEQPPSPADSLDIEAGSQEFLRQPEVDRAAS